MAGKKIYFRILDWPKKTDIDGRQKNTSAQSGFMLFPLCAKGRQHATKPRRDTWALQPVRESAEIFHLVIKNNLNSKLSINFCDELKLS